MFASHAVKPALSPAADGEIDRIDGKQAAIHQDAFIEPVGEREAHALALIGLLVSEVRPGLDPAELAMFLAALDADVGDDRGRLQAAERFTQQAVFAAAGLP